VGNQFEVQLDHDLRGFSTDPRGHVSCCGSGGWISEDYFMRKSDLSDAASNLLIVGSVSLAFAPFVLGDRLVLIVSGFMKEGGVMLDQLSNYVIWFFS
jgi:hypothetical protein